MKLVRAGMVWCSAFAGYLLFEGTLSSHELVTAAALAAGAVAWAFTILHCSPRRFAMSLAHAIPWFKAIAGAPSAVWRALLVFIKVAALGGSPGRGPELPFLRGAEDDPKDRTRRASAVLIASLAPDNFVVRAPPRKDRVLMHTILSTDATRDPRWLI